MENPGLHMKGHSKHCNRPFTSVAADNWFLSYILCFPHIAGSDEGQIYIYLSWSCPQIYSRKFFLLEGNSALKELIAFFCMYFISKRQPETGLDSINFKVGNSSRFHNRPIWGWKISKLQPTNKKFKHLSLILFLFVFIFDLKQL